jgi:cytoskeletal protein CcmA (bactofilin family)
LAGRAWQDIRVSLGSDAEVTGKLSFVGPTRIEGKLRGQVRAADLLVIGAHACVEATVRADRLVILGEVRGRIEGAGRVEVCAGGRLLGDVETRCLVIEEGATFEGNARMGHTPSAG